MMADCNYKLNVSVKFNRRVVRVIRAVARQANIAAEAHAAAQQEQEKLRDMLGRMADALQRSAEAKREKALP
jgi:hypothetical protein